MWLARARRANTAIPAPMATNGDAPSHRRDLALERARLLRDLCGEPVDPAELGLQAGREHDRLAAAVDDGGAHEHAVACLGDLDVRAGGLRHPPGGPALSGESRHLHRELAHLDEAAIGRDRVAGVEHHDVTGDELGGGYLGELAVAEHPREGRHHRLQRLSGPLGSVLLDEADPGVEEHDAQDADRELEIRRVSSACSTA